MSEVKAASASRYSPEDQAFHAFWYGHMHEDLIQAPLIGIAYSQARYIWDAARSTPKHGEAARCKNCDDTGDVHSIDGEWRGICHCPAGDSLRGVAACVTCGAPSVEPAPADPLSDFQEGQWWIKELDEAADSLTPDPENHDFKRAVAVVHHLLRAVRQHAIAQPAPHQEPRWQPIETAPKDGMPIFVGWGDGRDATPGNTAWARRRSGLWEDWEDECKFSPPTHWLPLPNTPKEPKP